jgi:hypothetical protein
MANRRIVYTNEVPYDLDILWSELNSYRAIGQLIDTVLGNTTELNGFNCIPSTPAALTVDVEPGQIYSEEETDTLAYGNTPTAGIPIDARPLMKQGMLLDAITLSTPAPATIGFSIKYLIQIAFQEVDDDLQNRPFYNAVSQNVANSRSDLADVVVKAGIAATTGTEATPTPDAGFTGAWVVTVANGQTTVTSGDIVRYSGAPFILEKLKDKISEATANQLYSKFETGDIEWSYRSTASPKAGWVPMIVGSIGSSASAASIRANDDTESLYTLLWDSVSSTYAPVSGGKGASADADFAANKTLTLPEAPGRALGIAGAGGGLTARSLGQFVGQENHTLIEAEMPSHTHTLNNAANLVEAFTGAGASPDGPPGNQAVTVTANAAGGGGAHNNMQPTLFLHAFIKL